MMISIVIEARQRGFSATFHTLLPNVPLGSYFPAHLLPWMVPLFGGLGFDLLLRCILETGAGRASELGRGLLEKLGTPIGNAKNATTCIFKKIGHLHVGACPCNPVVENALLTTWKELFLLILSKSEFFGQRIDSLTIGVFLPIGTKFQKGEHDALKIRYGHFFFPLLCDQANQRRQRASRQGRRVFRRLVKRLVLHQFSMILCC